MRGYVICGGEGISLIQVKNSKLSRYNTVQMKRNHLYDKRRVPFYNRPRRISDSRNNSLFKTVSLKGVIPLM